jgi:hypothetical protein
MFMLGRGYLKSFDPDVGESVDGTPVYPTGDAVFADDPTEALCFNTLQELLATYMTQSSTVPLRPDGKPNRPLTAFHMAPTSVNRLR